MNICKRTNANASAKQFNSSHNKLVWCVHLASMVYFFLHIFSNMISFVASGLALNVTLIDFKHEPSASIYRVYSSQILCTIRRNSYHIHCVFSESETFWIYCESRPQNRDHWQCNGNHIKRKACIEYQLTIAERHWNWKWNVQIYIRHLYEAHIMDFQRFVRVEWIGDEQQKGNSIDYIGELRRRERGKERERQR